MKKKKSRIAVIISSVLIFVSLAGILCFIGVYAFVRKNVDYSIDDAMFLSVQGHGSTKFFYDAGGGVGEYEPKEFCIYKGSNIKKQWFSYDKIGNNLKDAFISAEDRDFFIHNGVDFKRTAFAFLNYFLRLRDKFGGSTITQQVVKNMSGDNKQTITRKLTEIFRAIHLENVHSKEEILEVYMNIVPMGEGILGVGLASNYYFGKSPSELSYAEAATLVGITNAPTRYNPKRNPDKCVKKRNIVLYAMLECGVINEAQYEEAINSELTIVDYQDENESVDSWFLETVCDDIVRDLAKEKGISESAARIIINNGGLSVYTTVNPDIQNFLEEYFEKEEHFPNSINSGLNYSMVVTDSKNGNLLGIVGGVGRKSGNRLLNQATVPHTPGSALKPIALYAPLINEKRINWATVFDDVPVYFNKNSDGQYIPYPKNYPDVYDGLTTVADAIKVSKNTVAVRLYEMLGKDKIFNFLNETIGFDLVEKEKAKSGGTLTDKALAPLALGQLTHGVSLRELTGAYTAFPGEGQMSFSRSYVKVLDSSGSVVIDNQPKQIRVYSRECAQIMNKLLMQVTDSGTAKNISLGEFVDTAGKTGTSGKDKDRLFVGYTPYYTAGIWCGYSNGSKSIGNQSISHLQIWDEVMKEIHEMKLEKSDFVEFFSDNELSYLPYCKDSGLKFSQNCLLDPRSSRLEYGYFAYDNKPTQLCDRHVLCYYDEITGAVAHIGCPIENIKQIALLDISERSFPTEVFVTDAEFVWRKILEDTKLGDSYDVPYFIYTVEEGEFVGRSRKKKQFNSFCYLHDS